MNNKHLLKLLDLSREEIHEILDTADQLKYERSTASPTSSSRARPWP